MHYRTLGRTGLKVSVIGIGTWQLGGEWGKRFESSEVRAMFNTARECGINFLDTAECYGDHLSETLVGEAIQGRRDEWVVATKFGHHFRENFQRDEIFEPSAVVAQLEASLRALRTDYIDLYQFHSGKDHHFRTEMLWETLLAQKERGKIRHLGISVSPNTNLYQTSRATQVGAEVLQVIYNRLEREAEPEVLPSAQKQRLGVLARVPLASGFLSGNYRPGAQFPANDVREAWKKSGRDEKLAEVQRIAATEVPAGVPMAQWALAWCLRHPAVTAVIPGCKSPEQVRSNAAAATLDIDQNNHPQASA